MRDTLSYIERSGEKGIFVSLDQEKAFNRVNRPFLLKLLTHFVFGPSLRNWIFTLYQGAYIRILVNDFLTGPVYLQRGVRQGDALSPMLYIVLKSWLVLSELPLRSKASTLMTLLYL